MRMPTFLTRLLTGTPKNQATTFSLTTTADPSMDPPIPKKIRAVRRLSSPSGAVLGSQFPWASIAHQALVIGDPNDKDGVVRSELFRIDAKNVKQKTSESSKLSPFMVKQLQEADILGYTLMSNLEIQQAADTLINDHGSYNLLLRNCQHFAEKLAQSIIDPSISEPDAHIRYVFTNDSLKFMGSFDYSGSRPGWVLPTPTKVLVNVTATKDKDIWLGQVEGSGERGKFLRKAVERA